MPKVMVLFFGDDDSSALADAAASGAKAVRFTEVDVRAASNASARHKPLGADHRFANYDGVMLVSAQRELEPAASATFAALQDNDPNNPNNPHDAKSASGSSGSNVSNVVIGVIGPNAALLEWAARSGGILVTQRGSFDEAAAVEGETAVVTAKALGARVAKVAGWVRHALGHEAEHGATHHHDHAPQHSHEPSHTHSHEHDH